MKRTSSPQDISSSGLRSSTSYLNSAIRSTGLSPDADLVLDDSMFPHHDHASLHSIPETEGHHGGLWGEAAFADEHGAFTGEILV